MKELCSYVKAKQSENARLHRTMVTQGNYCSGLTTKEYNRVKTSVKKVGAKSRSHAHTTLWSYNSEGINLQK